MRYEAWRSRPIVACMLAVGLVGATCSRAAVDVADDPAMGESTAPLVLIEFADYQ